MIIFLNGNFDILHSGHFNLLNFCRTLAGPNGKVIVGIDSDRRISQLKGSIRPICRQDIRLINLRILKFMDSPMVDEIKIFDSDEELYNLIKTTSPDIIVKGDDWKGKKVIGDDISKIHFYKCSTNYYGKISTSKIIEMVLDKNIEAEIIEYIS